MKIWSKYPAAEKVMASFLSVLMCLFSLTPIPAVYAGGELTQDPATVMPERSYDPTQDPDSIDPELAQVVAAISGDLGIPTSNLKVRLYKRALQTITGDPAWAGGGEILPDKKEFGVDVTVSDGQHFVGVVTKSPSMQDVIGAQPTYTFAKIKTDLSYKTVENIAASLSVDMLAIESISPSLGIPVPNVGNALGLITDVFLKNESKDSLRKHAVTVLHGTTFDLDGARILYSVARSVYTELKAEAFDAIVKKLQEEDSSIRHHDIVSIKSTAVYLGAVCKGPGCPVSQWNITVTVRHPAENLMGYVDREHIGTITELFAQGYKVEFNNEALIRQHMAFKQLSVLFGLPLETLKALAEVKVIENNVKFYIKPGKMALPRIMAHLGTGDLPYFAEVVMGVIGQTASIPPSSIYGIQSVDLEFKSEEGVIKAHLTYTQSSQTLNRIVWTLLNNKDPREVIKTLYSDRYGKFDSNGMPVSIIRQFEPYYDKPAPGVMNGPSWSISIEQGKWIMQILESPSNIVTKFDYTFIDPPPCGANLPGLPPCPDVTRMLVGMNRFGPDGKSLSVTQIQGSRAFVSITNDPREVMREIIFKSLEDLLAQVEKLEKGSISGERGYQTLTHALAALEGVDLSQIQIYENGVGNGLGFYSVMTSAGRKYYTVVVKIADDRWFVDNKQQADIKIVFKAVFSGVAGVDYASTVLESIIPILNIQADPRGDAFALVFWVTPPCAPGMMCVAIAQRVEAMGYRRWQGETPIYEVELKKDDIAGKKAELLAKADAEILMVTKKINSLENLIKVFQESLPGKIAAYRAEVEKNRVDAEALVNEMEQAAANENLGNEFRVQAREIADAVRGLLVVLPEQAESYIRIVLSFIGAPHELPGWRSYLTALESFKKSVASASTLEALNALKFPRPLIVMTSMAYFVNPLETLRDTIQQKAGVIDQIRKQIESAGSAFETQRQELLVKVDAAIAVTKAEIKSLQDSLPGLIQRIKEGLAQELAEMREGMAQWEEILAELRKLMPEVPTGDIGNYLNETKSFYDIFLRIINSVANANPELSPEVRDTKGRIEALTKSLPALETYRKQIVLGILNAPFPPAIERLQIVVDRWWPMYGKHHLRDVMDQGRGLVEFTQNENRERLEKKRAEMLAMLEPVTKRMASTLAQIQRLIQDHQANDLKVKAAVLELGKIEAQIRELSPGVSSDILKNVELYLAEVSKFKSEISGKSTSDLARLNESFKFFQRKAEKIETVKAQILKAQSLQDLGVLETEVQSLAYTIEDPILPRPVDFSARYEDLKARGLKLIEELKSSQNENREKLEKKRAEMLAMLEPVTKRMASTLAQIQRLIQDHQANDLKVKAAVLELGKIEAQIRELSPGVSSDILKNVELYLAEVSKFKSEISGKSTSDLAGLKQSLGFFQRKAETIEAIKAQILKAQSLQELGVLETKVQSLAYTIEDPILPRPVDFSARYEDLKARGQQWIADMKKVRQPLTEGIVKDVLDAHHKTAVNKIHELKLGSNGQTASVKYSAMIQGQMFYFAATIDALRQVSSHEASTHDAMRMLYAESNTNVAFSDVSVSFETFKPVLPRISGVISYDYGVSFTVKGSKVKKTVRWTRNLRSGTLYRNTYKFI